MEVIAVIVVVLIIAFFIAAQFSGSNDPFQTAAAALGLKLTRSVPDLLPNIEGMVKGLPVRIDIPQRGATVRYRVFYPTLGMTLRLERETSVSRTMGELGKTDIQVGEAAFDNTFKVNTSRPDALREMMTPELRRTLVQLLEAYPGMRIEDGEITYVSNTAEPDREEIVRTTSSMATAAEQLVSKRPPPLQKPQASPRPQQKASEQARQPATPPASQSDRPRNEAPAAAPPSARAEVAAPAPPTPTDPVPEPPPPPSPKPDTGLPDGFFEEAFGDTRLSFENDGRFEERYRGKTVFLSGTVKQAREIEDDNTVSVGPSTKATVTVAQIDNDLYGKTDIDALVFLPAGSTKELDRGTQISFTGTLESIDPFMRNVWVTDARLQT